MGEMGHAFHNFIHDYALDTQIGLWDNGLGDNHHEPNRRYKGVFYRRPVFGFPRKDALAFRRPVLGM